MENYDKLKQVIQQSNPERFSLRDPHSAPGSYEYNYPRCGDCFCSIQETHTHFEDDIRLADVLVAVQKVVHPLGKTFGLDETQKQVLWHWKCQDDNLDHQSDGTKQFLIDLLTIR